MGHRAHVCVSPPRRRVGVAYVLEPWAQYMANEWWWTANVFSQVDEVANYRRASVTLYGGVDAAEYSFLRRSSWKTSNKWSTNGVTPTELVVNVTMLENISRLLKQKSCKFKYFQSGCNWLLKTICNAVGDLLSLKCSPFFTQSFRAPVSL